MTSAPDSPAANPRAPEAFRALNIVAAADSPAFEANRVWLSKPSNAKLLEDAIASGFRPNPAYDLTYFGGHTVQDSIIQLFYVGSGDPAAHNSWNAPDRASIDAAVSNAFADANLNSVIDQYFSKPTSARVEPSQSLVNAATTFQQADVETMVTNAFGAGLLVGDDASTVYCFLLAPSVRLFDNSGSDSHNGLGGYHGSVACTDPSGNPHTVYYAVGVYSDVEDVGGVQVTNGIIGFNDSWKNVAATFYHEINEFRTDPDVEKATTISQGVLGWYSAHYGEVGDIPIEEAGPNLSEVMKEVPLANGQGTVPIQLMYSNRDHGPAASSSGSVAGPTPPSATSPPSASASPH